MVAGSRYAESPGYAQRNLTELLVTSTAPVILGVFLDLKDDARAAGQHRAQRSEAFRNLCRGTRNWNEEIGAVGKRLLSACPDLMKIVKGIFLANAKVMLSLQNGRTKGLDLAVPPLEAFTRSVIMNSAVSLADYYSLLCEVESPATHAIPSARDQVMKIIAKAVEVTLVHMLPMVSILDTCLAAAAEREDDGASSAADSDGEDRHGDKEAAGAASMPPGDPAAAGTGLPAPQVPLGMPGAQGVPGMPAGMPPPRFYGFPPYGLPPGYPGARYPFPPGMMPPFPPPTPRDGSDSDDDGRSSRARPARRRSSRGSRRRSDRGRGSDDSAGSDAEKRESREEEKAHAEEERTEDRPEPEEEAPADEAPSAPAAEDFEDAASIAPPPSEAETDASSMYGGGSRRVRVTKAPAVGAAPPAPVPQQKGRGARPKAPAKVPAPPKETSSHPGFAVVYPGADDDEAVPGWD
eukprot:tig00000492_g1522.t1